MLSAITREVSAEIGRCELSYQPRVPIDIGLARAQHRAYERCLADAGCIVRRLPAADDLPDAVFVEDTAVVLDEVALVTRPGAASRRPETRDVAEVLRPHRLLFHLEAPAVLDGGDVLVLGKRLFVGLSRRSNEAAIQQMRYLLSDYGYSLAGVQVRGCLHLKSAVTQVAEDALLVNPDWIDTGAFESLSRISVDSREPSAANALRIGNLVIFPTAFPATRRRLEARGIRVCSVDVSELAKAEGAVTCCSLIFEI
jgi:dimethylargininase